MSLPHTPVRHDVVRLGEEEQLRASGEPATSTLTSMTSAGAPATETSASNERSLATEDATSSEAERRQPRAMPTRAIASLRRQVPVYLFGRLIPAALSFVTLAAFTRYLSPSDFGVYAMVIASAGLAHAVLYNWINASVLRFLSGAEDRGSILGLAGVMFGRVTGAAVGIALVATPLVPPTQRSALFLTLALTVVQSWLRLHLTVFRAEMRPVLYTVVEIARAAGALGLGVLFARVGWGANGVVLGVLVAYLVPGLLTTRNVWSNARRTDRPPTASKDFLAYGLPTIASLAFSYVVRSSDRLMLGWLASASEAGLYAAGYDLAFQTVDALLGVANLAAFPLLVKAAEGGNPGEVKEQATKNVVLLTAIGLPATVGLVLMASEIASVMLGSAFSASAAAILPPVCVAALISGYKSYYFDHAFHVGRRTINLVTIGAISALLNVLLNLAVIPAYGGIGAAWTTVACFMVSLTLSALGGRRLLRLPVPTRELSPLVVAAAVMGFAVLLLPPGRSASQLVVKLSVASAVYGAVLLAFDASGIRGHVRAIWRRA